MYLAFATKDLREICEREEVAIGAFGSELTALLHARLSDLMAAKGLWDLPGLPPTLVSNCRNVMCLELEDGYQIRFVANHTNMPTDKFGEGDWERISRIRIVGAQRYDG